MLSSGFLLIQNLFSFFGQNHRMDIFIYKINYMMQAHGIDWYLLLYIEMIINDKFYFITILFYLKKFNFIKIHLQSLSLEHITWQAH